MTRAAFVDFSCNIFDKHHVYCLFSYLTVKGIEVEYINEKTFKETIDRIKEINPDVLLYSAFSIDADIYFKFDKIVKERLNIKSIMGGAGPTFDWSLSDRGTIDAICIGEGEYALEEYLKSGFSGGKNIVLGGEKSPKEFHRFVDLDSIPVPDRSIVYEKDNVLRSMPSKQFLAGRGCPYRCTYCYNNIFNRVFKGCGPIIWLFQILVDFPSLYWNKIILNMLFVFPTWMLRFLFQLHYLYKFSRQYKVKTPFRISWLILIRHLRDTLELHRPDKST